MKKICIVVCFYLLCTFSTVLAMQNMSTDLSWGKTYDEINEKYPLVYNNHLDEENANTYWLKTDEPYLNGREIAGGRILLYFRDNKLYRITADFTDGTCLNLQDESTGNKKAIGKNLYWGASYAQVSAFYELKYKEHDNRRNSPVYYMILPNTNFMGEKLKSPQVLAYFWNDQLYKIVAEKENGDQFVLQDDFLLQKAGAQGALNEQRKTHDEKAARMNEEIAAEAPQNEAEETKIIPGLYWGESINDIVKDYAVKYIERYSEENALVYELDLQNPYTKEDKAYNDFIKTRQNSTKKVLLYLWQNKLYKIELEYNDNTKQQFMNVKTAKRAALDGEVYKLGGGTFLKQKYREVYADSMNGKLYMYWGQPFEEMFDIYELNQGIAWPTIYIYSLALNNPYREGAPYLIVMFSRGKLYKILLCFDESIQNRQQEYYDNMKKILTEKFGRPDIYGQDILMWQSKTVPVDKKEEAFLKNYLDGAIIRTAHLYSLK